MNIGIRDSEDSQLQDISQGLNRLNRLGTAIGQTAGLQQSLLDTIDDDIEDGAHQMSDDIQQVAKLNKNTRTCHLWVLIVLLSISLIVILVLN